MAAKPYPAYQIQARCAFTSPGFLPDKTHDDAGVVGLISEAPSGIAILPDGGEALSCLGNPGPVRVYVTGLFVVGLISEAPSGVAPSPDGGEALSGLGNRGPVRVNATGPFANVTRPSRCN